jgi:chaperone LolA
MIRLLGRSAALAAVVALAACGGRESSADAPANGRAPRGDAARAQDGAPAPQLAGGDTADAAAASAATVGAPPAGSPAAGPPPVAPAAGTPAVGAPAPAAPAPARAPGSAPAAPAGRSSDEAAEILRRAEQTADGIRSLEADFTQSLSVPLLGTRQSSAGKMYQRKPDRFLMRFTQPAGDIMVADGRHFWLYYPSSDRTQVIRTSIAKGGGAVDLQRQFIGNATARFVATLNGSESVGGQDTHVLTLVPKQDSPYKILKIWVDKDDFLVRRFETTEENESVRRVELRNIRTNGTLPDALFAFTPPAGTQVFDQ